MTTHAKLYKAAVEAKLLLEQLEHVGGGLEYDGLDESSALGNVAALLAQSPALQLLREALSEPEGPIVPFILKVSSGQIDEERIERMKSAKAAHGLTLENDPDTGKAVFDWLASQGVRASSTDQDDWCTLRKEGFSVYPLALGPLKTHPKKVLRAICRHFELDPSTIPDLPV